MALSVVRRTANRPLIAAVWLFTLFALIPFHTLPGLLFSGLLNLLANALALVLVCSPARADRLHGWVRLGLQILTLIVGTIFLFRSGASLQGLYQFATHSLSNHS
jgi:hypothetical protein